MILFVLQVVMLRTAGERWTFPFRGCSTGGRTMYADKYGGQVQVRSCDHHVTATHL